MQRASTIIAVMAVTGGLAGCGGGGGGGGDGSGSTQDTATETGVFKDANVSGLEYSSGGQQGVTGSDGEFTYEVGETVTFTVGGVTVGTTDGAAVITPVDLGDGGDATATDVVNRVRFLLLLDSDDNADNGIQISDGVRDLAGDWNSIDFAAGDLQGQLTSIRSDVQSVDGDATLPSRAEARSHFTGTLRCLFSGAFTGTFEGDRNGRIALLVRAADGAVVGGGFTPARNNRFELDSDSAVTLDTERRFISGTTSGGASYEGRFARDGTLAGEWSESNSSQTISGTFQGNRLAGDIQADYRFAAVYRDPDQGSDVGIFAFDIDGTDVSGTAYSVLTGDTTSIDGSVTSGTDLQATTGDGTTITATIGTALGALDGSTTLSGTWVDDSNDGSLSGDGCRLN